MLAETGEVVEQGRGYFERVSEPRGIIGPPAVLMHLERHFTALAEVNQFSAGAASADRRPDLGAGVLPTFPHDAAAATAELVSMARAGAIVCCQNQGEADRANELLAAADAPTNIRVCACYVHRGFTWHDADAPPVAVVPFHELMSRFSVRRRAGRCGPGEPSCFLSWQWPGAIAHWTESDWPKTRLQSWFFAMLALSLAPLGDQFGSLGAGGEISARLRFMFMHIRKEAIAGFYRRLGCDGPYSTESDQIVFENMQELFEETDTLCPEFGSPEFEQSEQNLPPNLRRFNRLHRALWEFDEVLRRQQFVIFESIPIFSLQPGMWVRDHLMRPGQVLEFREGYAIVDWGRLGFRREYGLLGAWRPRAWRWPVKNADDFESPDRPILHRWRAFSLANQTWDLIICPCCGYPHMDEIEEIVDCPICAWPL